MARGIQSKRIRGLGAESPVGGGEGETPHKNGWSRRAEPPHNFFFRIRLNPERTTKLKYKIDHKSKTKYCTKKKSCVQKLGARSIPIYPENLAAFEES